MSIHVLSTSTLKWFALACLFALQTACSPCGSRCHANLIKEAGGYEQAAQQGVIEGFSEVNDLCERFLDDRFYSELLECLDEYERQIKQSAVYAAEGSKEDQSLWDVQQYIRDYARYTILRARQQIDFGDYSQAYGAAQQMIDEMISYDFVPTRYYRELLRLSGIAAAGFGNIVAARKHAMNITQIDIGIVGRKESDADNRMAAFDIYYALGHYEEAREQLSGSFAISISDVLWTGMHLYAARNPGAISVAPLDYARVAQEAAKSGEAPSSREIPLYFRSAILEAEAGSTFNARVLFEQIYASSATKDQYPEIYYGGLVPYADVLAFTGMKDTALELYKEAIAHIESSRERINALASKHGYMQGRNGAYEGIVKLLVKMGKPREALIYAERAKSLYFIDQLKGKFDFKGYGEDLKDRLVQIRSMEIQSIGSKKPQERAALRKAKDSLNRDYPDIAKVVDLSSVSIERMATDLNFRGDLISYFVTEDYFYVFLLNETGVKVEVTSPSVVTEALYEHLNVIRDAKSENYQETSKRLYELLIAPVAQDISKDLLTILPHVFLHYLPFASLFDGESYLIEKYAVRSAPNFAMLENTVDQTPANKRALIIGDVAYDQKLAPLPMTSLELEAVRRSVIDSTVLERKNATEENFRSLAGKHGVIHFSGHALFDEKSPLDSALVLANEVNSEEDGLLTASEIYNLNINADLVALSACETGLGKASAGNEVVGITHAFLFSGARSVLSSLWPVTDEETGYLMMQFYKEMRSAPSKAEALRKAQLAVMKTVNAHPFYWSAFQLNGT